MTSVTVLYEEPCLKPEFVNIWNEKIQDLLSKGVMWIDDELIWERFCNFNQINAENPSEISYLDLEKLQDMDEKKLSNEILKAFNSVIQEFM